MNNILPGCLAKTRYDSCLFIVTIKCKPNHEWDYFAISPTRCWWFNEQSEWIKDVSR